MKNQTTAHLQNMYKVFDENKTSEKIIKRNKTKYLIEKRKEEKEKNYARIEKTRKIRRTETRKTLQITPTKREKIIQNKPRTSKY